MSADNGIYILPSPTVQGVEYRVAHAQAIENIDYDPLYEVMIFHDSPVYASEQEAVLAALQKSKSYDILEYGIAVLPLRKEEFPKLSVQEANTRLWGNH